ncbi:Unconventional myosin-XVIIIa [Frankliniella fusca]|uniref:Unconventional myosin-XVIIIa n=1 Tax=Frankliniella fusca TaxID=407009 RepID=A0AAE1H004_9NEOP|nr:Unconventional myosin-XVIIIa [Frankliniella fusca]
MRELKSPAVGVGVAPPYSPLGLLGSVGAPLSLSHRTSESNLRRCGGVTSRASQKSSLLYDFLDARDLGPQRSVSLTTLSPSAGVPVSMVSSPASPGSVCTNGDPDLEPRMAQLETLEAKMASIEVSLSTTPRRKKNGSIGSAAGVTAAAAVATNGVVGVANHSPYRGGHGAGAGTGLALSLAPGPQASPGHHAAPSPATPVANRDSGRDLGRELDALRNALRDKENLIQSLRGQLMNGSHPVTPAATPAPPPAAPATPATPATWPHVQQRPPPSEKERRAAEERLGKLRLEVDNKRLAIKNLKMALERLDITDNIDVRIQQAELEYQLGREELNLLSLLEETRNVAALLEEAERARSSQAANTLYSCVGSAGRAALVSVQVQYDPKSPQFGAGPRDDAPGLYVHWATDTSGMAKGDRVLEVNGKLVLSKSRDDMHRLLAVSPDPAQLVLLRAAPEQDLSALSAQLSAERERALQAERSADSLRADSVRLSHRISYLEDQVSELLTSGGGGQHHGSTAGPQRSASANVSTVIVTASSSPSPSPSDVQLYQKGSQVSSHSNQYPNSSNNNNNSNHHYNKPHRRLVQLVSNLPRLEASLRSKRLDKEDKQDPQRLERLEQRLERSRRQSHSSSSGNLSLQLARSTNALDVFSAESPRGPVQHIRIRQSPSQPDGLASDSDIRRPRRKSEAHGLSEHGHGHGLGGGSRHYRKHHEYCSSGGEGAGGSVRPEAQARPASSSSTSRPVPPRKPLRLSLHRAASLQSVESAPPGSGGPGPGSSTPGGLADKKAPKRNHKGEAPVPPGSGAEPAGQAQGQSQGQQPAGIPSDAPHPHPFQSALRWTAPSSSASSPAPHLYRSSGNLSEKWC